ncbi:MAG: hypothetical protein M0037_14680 [Betaproteobacteria bacterium]|nr:hypothetical protein [Betaproteobacteria bacterium]
MGREWLLSVLIIVLGGLSTQALAWLPGRDGAHAQAEARERACWYRLWQPIAPMLLIAAGLCGWALTQPDPVPDRLEPWGLYGAWLPFALIFGRACLRAGWALLRSPAECGIATVGFLQPQVVFSPFLAKGLEERAIRAALAHEAAHAKHRDPARIWLAQFATDLQWPWPAAARRLDRWREALELARDDEARAGGVDGADLAAAVLATVRFLGRAAPERRAGLGGSEPAHARLVDDARALRERVSRLLAPLPEAARGRRGRGRRPGLAVLLMLAALLAATGLGIVYGERLVQPLLALTL